MSKSLAMANMKPDQERVKSLLTDTVTLLCKNGLQFSKELKVQGLLGITLDNNDVFVVHINEIFGGVFGAQVTNILPEEKSTSAIAAADSATSDASLRKSVKSVPRTQASPSPSGSRKRKSVPHSRSESFVQRIKTECTDDDDLMIMENETGKTDFATDSNAQTEGDREAMRKSYGRLYNHSETPPVKQRIPDSISESYSDNRQTTVPVNDEILLDSSMDGSQMSGMGRSTTDAYHQTPGFSGWEQMSALHPGDTTSHDRSEARIRNPAPHPWPAIIPPLSPMRANLQLGGGTKRRRILFRRDSKCPDKPYHCQFDGCNKSFYRGPERNRHQRLKHGSLYSEHDGVDKQRDLNARQYFHDLHNDDHVDNESSAQMDNFDDSQ